MQEIFTYTAGGRVKTYTKYLAKGYYNACGLLNNLTQTSDNKKIWSYRYSALSSREQKRLLKSPYGDSLCHDTTHYHPWTYYLLGAAGEQLAVYKGVQTAATDAAGHTGRRVYMYPYQYMTAGMCFLPDSTKEFNVCDHLGSVRMIVRVKNDTITYKHYDYKPFGDTLNADKEERLGYLSDEKDKENNYIMMNFRTYDSKTGRFLSVDPLFESMPGQSPYNYSYNNPMGYADPSGLKPEKAKGDKIQADLNLGDCVASYYARFFAECLSNKIAEYSGCYYGEFYNGDFNHPEGCFGGGGGGRGSNGSGASRMGTQGSSNGQCYDGPVIIEFAPGVILPDGVTKDQVIAEIHEVLDRNAELFEKGLELGIIPNFLIKNGEDIAKDFNDENGIQNGKSYLNGKYDISTGVCEIAAKCFATGWNEPFNVQGDYYIGMDYKHMDDIIIHEYAHCFLYKYDNNYSAYSHAIKEGMAEHIVNDFRERRHEYPVEIQYNTQLWYFPSGWWTYSITKWDPFHK